MKAILVIDVPMLDDGRHLCNECPIWNRDRFLCEYDFNMEAKGCPLKPFDYRRGALGSVINHDGYTLSDAVELLDEIMGDAE